MFTDLCLNFNDETEMNSVLYTTIPATYELDADGNPTETIISEEYLSPKYKNISAVGVVYKRAPVPTPEDYVPEPYPAPNYGVNIRLDGDEDIESLRPYIVQPKNPVRVWA
jgi:hypothetical protein